MLGLRGPCMTWCNRRDGYHHIKERLDRVLVSTAWNLSFPNALICHLEDIGFDHRPILLNIDLSFRKGKKRFIFDARWKGVAEVEKVVHSAWLKTVKGHNMFSVS